MNRNNERHFNNVPQTHVSRTRFKRDQNILTTFNAGRLIPFYVDEVLPGDTFDVNTAAIIRMTTPKYPVFDDAYIDFYYFYCPNRILWNNFKRFMGEADEEPWTPTKTYEVPKVRIVGNPNKENQPEAYKGPKTHSILDYMGVPTNLNSDGNKQDIKINALPVRAYIKIWNEFFRDQNITNPAAYQNGDEEATYFDRGEEGYEGEQKGKELNDAYTGGTCLPVSKFHDYFSSCLPYPQRGPEVTIGLTGNAPVTTFETENLETELQHNYGTNFNATSIPTPGETKVNTLAFNDGEKNGYLGANLSNIEAATINQLRQAFAVQHYYEALARGGSRYREQVRALFGVSISDKTVQIPEYLGGGRYHVNINQIVQTSGQQTENDTPIGETGAMSVTPINESSFTKSFEEHGFVIGVMCVRHDHSYQQGLERFWSRSDRLDYYYPQFANLGEQPVKKKEIMLTGTSTDDETFGYQEAWADYRMKPNRVSGKMRSNAQGTLDFWHYADNYNEVPTLSQEWMNEGKDEIARTLIVQNEPQFFGAIRVMNKTTRCMPLYSVPGLEKL